MGRPRLPDRAWHRWNKTEGRFEIVDVRRGRRHCTLCPAGTTEEGARRAAEIVDATLRKSDSIPPAEWGDADEEGSAVAMFLAAAATGQHREKPKRGKVTNLRKGTLDWYKFRLREAGRVLAGLKGEGFDPLALSTDDGDDFVAARGAEIAPSEIAMGALPPKKHEDDPERVRMAAEKAARAAEKEAEAQAREARKQERAAAAAEKAREKQERVAERERKRAEKEARSRGAAAKGA